MKIQKFKLILILDLSTESLLNPKLLLMCHVSLILGDIDKMHCITIKTILYYTITYFILLIYRKVWFISPFNYDSSKVQSSLLIRLISMLWIKSWLCAGVIFWMIFLKYILANSKPLHTFKIFLKAWVDLAHFRMTLIIRFSRFSWRFFTPKQGAS